MNPFLYGLVSLIWLITQLSGAPNPARSPVSGWIHPIVIDLPLDALAVLPVRSRSGSVVAAVNLAIPWSPVAKSELVALLGPAVQGAARQISARVV